VLFGGIVLGLVLGLAVGGRLDNLLAVRLRWPLLLFGAVAVRLGTEAALGRGIALAETLRLPLLLAAYGVLAVALWANRARPGLSLALIGIASNAAAMAANGGFMPVWEPSLVAAGFSPTEALSPIHVLLPPVLDAGFLVHAGPLGDLVPIPIPFARNVASIGDVFLSLGLAFFLFESVVRTPEEVGGPELDRAAREGRLSGFAAAARLPRGVAGVVVGTPIRPETGLASGLAEAAALDRPVVFGGSGAGLVMPALAPLPLDDAGLAPPGTMAAAPSAGTAVLGRAIRPSLRARLRGHPYVRLALNGPFSALWVSQVVSLFGDRIHQIALVFLFLNATGSAVAVSLAFAVATVPNLLLGPIAGTLVDRWDQKQVLVVSDLLRASIVLLLPVAATVNIVLVYPLVFTLTSVSIFFRPARTAVIPRIVAEDDLLTANSATWVGDTLADVIGYPVAGLFVGFLGAALPLAFWVDGATYVASAVLILAVAIPPVARSTATAMGGVFADLRAGWRFLRNEPVLLANTAQAVVAQFSAGVTIALTPIYAAVVLQSREAYAFLETGIGVGNLVGGFIIGLLGARLAKGPMVIVGYVGYGLCVAGLALTGHVDIAIGLAAGMGVMNMVYIIPSQTLFQERTPGDMIGRVVGFRFAAVLGSLTLAQAVSGFLSDAFGVGLVIGAFGVVTVIAGLAGLLSRPLRNA